MNRFHGTTMTGVVTRVAALTVGYGQSKQSIGQEVTVTVKVPYVSLPSEYEAEPKSKYQEIEVRFFLGSAEYPPRIGQELDVTIDVPDTIEEQEG